MKIKLCFIINLWLCGIAIQSYAQQASITGKVTDEQGQALQGVSVIASSGSTSVTSADGSYSITVSDLSVAKLTFSYIGYVTRELDVRGQRVINIEMAEEISALDEVVVTALGISRDTRELGYSRQSVNVEEMTEARDPNITNMLAGKVAGLQITTSGQPTGSTSIVLRGMGSLTGSNEPLWVIDGVPIDNSHGQRDDLDYGNAASDLNPDDIANIEVLKGPNASALYGSKAANGAIIITTKKGTMGGGKLGVSVGSNFMISSIAEFPSYQNVYGEGNASRMPQNNGNLDANGLYRMGTNPRSWGSPMLGQPYATFAGELTAEGYVPQPNNISDLFQSAATGIQNISFSKADENSALRFSYTFTHGNDVLDQQNIRNRHNLNFTGEKKFAKSISVSTRIQYTNDNVQNRTFRNLNNNNPMNSYIYMLRSIPLSAMTPWKDEFGNAFTVPGQGSNFENPYWLIYENGNQDIKERLIGGVTALIDITGDLKFRTQVTGDLAFGNGHVFVQKGGQQNITGAYSNFMQENKVWNTEGLLMYNRSFSKFSFTANLGGNLRSDDFRRSGARTGTLAVHNVRNISNTLSNPITFEDVLRSRINSLFGNATLGYNDYLFLEVTGRNDWSSTLPPESLSFFYPSLSGSFVFSDFFKLNPKIVTMGKLRASVARVGNDASPYNLVSAFNFEGIFNGNTYVSYDGLQKNANLKPELTTSTELGLDLRLFNGRLTFDGTVYRASTINQIFSAQVARETGFLNKLVNAGEVQNKGIEISLGGRPIDLRDFKWDVSVNWAANRNMVVSLYPGVDRLRIGSNASMSVNIEAGHPIGVIRGQDVLRDPNGVIMIMPDGNPFEESDVYFGNFQPKWLGSFGSNFRYKRFDLSFLLTSNWGGRIYSISHHRANIAGNTVMSLEGREDYLFSNRILGESGLELQGITQIYDLPYPDAERPKGSRYDNSAFPLGYENGDIVYDANGRMIADDFNTPYIATHSYWARLGRYMHYDLFNSSFIRLNQLIFGYTVPDVWASTIGFQTARISFVGRNMWTIYKRTPQGVDPESASSSGNNRGMEMGGSLPYATYGFDLKLSF